MNIHPPIFLSLKNFICMKIKIHIAILLIALGYINSFGQVQTTGPATTEAPAPPKSNANTIEEMKLKLNEDGSHYLKWTFMNQVWFRYNQSNPGTLVLGERANNTFDIGLRRTRMQFFGQL